MTKQHINRNFSPRRANAPSQGDGANRAAFTLIELAVVLAMLGVITIMVLPALAGTKATSKSFQCMNNMKQLAMAWTMYADANSERLVNLSTYPNNGSATLAGNVPWRTQISYESLSFPAGLTAGSAAAQRYLAEMGYKQPVNNTGPANTINGPLYPYAPFVDSIHCPADFRASLPASVYGTYGGPYTWGSYNGVGYLNGEKGGFTKRTQVLHPAGRMILVEESDMRGENLGSWLMTDGTASLNFAGAYFVDPPAAFHNGASDFNFCDGHVEIHKWQNSATVAYANDTSNTKSSNVGGTKTAATQPGNVDAIWTASHDATAANP